MSFEAGQQWAYAAAPGLEDSRILIGAILDYDGGQRIACCAVLAGIERGADGEPERVTIPFLPLTLDALARSVTELDGTAELPDAFAGQLQAWLDDPRGASYFTVPFEGSLERLIGQQMTAIVGQG